MKRKKKLLKPEIKSQNLINFRFDDHNFYDILIRFNVISTFYYRDILMIYRK